MKPKQFFYVLLGIVVVAIGLGGAGYYYAMQYVRTQSTQLATEQAIQETAAQQIEQVDTLGAEYQKQVVPIMSLINDALPTDKNQTEILAQIERLAADNNMSVGTISMPNPTGLPSGASQTVSLGDVLALPIDFSVTGPYASLQTFTQALENLDRFTNITSLTIQGQAGGIAEYTYNLDAYIKP